MNERVTICYPSRFYKKFQDGLPLKDHRVDKYLNYTGSLELI